MDALGRAFAEHDIPNWCGVTRSLPADDRAEEILDWLQAHVTEPSVAVAIDDSADIAIGDDHGLPVRYKPLVTDFETGLTAGVVQDALAWFAGPG